MTVDYDKVTDTLSIQFRVADIEETEEVSEGVLMDRDEHGEMVSLEILDASKKLDTVEVFVLNSDGVVVSEPAFQ